METPELQQAFFNTLKSTLPSHISMVDEIAGVLNIGYDSVYRRIRGEKPIAISELKILCDHFHISLDQVLQLKNESVVFQAPGINDTEPQFEDYLKGILAQFKIFNSYDRREMFYLCKDAPIWHFFLFPEIGAFKTFCWIKTIQNHPEYQDKRFSLTEFSFPECYAIGQQILSEYYRVPSVELWNFESLNSTINQIEYYRDAGLFLKPEELNIVLNSLDNMLNHLQRQAESGRKYAPGNSDVAHRAGYRFYVNEVILGNNTILLELNDDRLCFINYNVIYYLSTKDARFINRSFQSFNTLLSRSTMISGTGEKFRNKFFGYLRERVMNLRK